MQYTITKMFGTAQSTNPETLLEEKFTDLNEAKSFIQEKMKEDSNLKIKSIYRLYNDLDILVEEFDSTKVQMSSQEAESSSQGKGSGVSFRPTPFNTSPRPGGPPKWLKSDDEEDKDKK